MTPPLVVTPLEILSLAETRRRDPELALRIAEASALAPITKKENTDVRTSRS